MTAAPKTMRKNGYSVSLGIIIALGIYLKEFYLFSSGSLQPGDMLLFGAFLFALLNRRIRLKSIDYPCIVFFVLAIGINIFYSLYYDNSSFITYATFLVFSLLIVLLARSICENQVVIRYILIALKAAILTQVGVSFLGRGRSLFDRYTGTFNDPNQFGYYVLMAMFLILLLHHMRGEKMKLYWFALTAYLIARSQSSGMFLGLAVFFAVYIWRLTVGKRTKLIWVLRILLIFLVLSALFLMLVTNDHDTSISVGANISGWQRLNNRLSGVISIDKLLERYFSDRSMLRIFENPWPFLYGAGEGYWERYVQGNEIHATMISLCYYFGIIPYSFWIVWLKRNLRKLSPALYCIYIAVIAEAFTLANHRQPFFWMLFVFASSRLSKSSNIPDSKGCETRK